MKHWAVAIGAGLLLSTCAFSATLGNEKPRIVSGSPTQDFPSVGLFLAGTSLCTGTLVGCQTFLTAAHCVCGDVPGAQCGKRPDLLNPGNKSVLFQHAGWVGVSSVDVHPQFQFGERSDLAVLHLAAPVTGIAPSPLHRGAKPAAGTAGVLVGFGRPDGTGGSGLKREGMVQIAPCTAAPQATHVCWGTTESSTCHGDSGGPLFLQEKGGLALAGVTSGGDPACLAPGRAFDADVALDAGWIDSQIGTDSRSSCGGLPAAGTSAARITGAEGTLGAGKATGQDEDFTVEVAAGTSRLRVELNTSPVGAYFNLYVKREAPASPASFDCKSENAGGLEFCDLPNPAPGTWHLDVHRSSGAADFQVVATTFQSATAPCVPSGATLCLGDGRFRVEATFRAAGAPTGTAQTVPLTPDTGYLWFFDPGNTEVVVKVLDGCAANGRFWVFAGGLTNVQVNLSVTDTRTGAVRTYTNPQRTPFAPIQDANAFACP